MANPYMRGNTAALTGGYAFYEVDVSSADHTFTALPRALLVSNSGSAVRTLAIRAEGATADVTIAFGPGTTLLPLAPEIVRTNANLTVVAVP